jgi:hypothetical protein
MMASIISTPGNGKGKPAFLFRPALVKDVLTLAFFSPCVEMMLAIIFFVTLPK